MFMISPAFVLSVILPTLETPTACNFPQVDDFFFLEQFNFKDLTDNSSL